MWRVTVLFTVPVVLLGFLSVGNSPAGLMAPRALAPLVISLFVYGVLARGLGK